MILSGIKTLLDTAAEAYVEHLLGTRAMREWYADALKETLRDQTHDVEIAHCGEVLEDLRALVPRRRNKTGGL